MPRLRKRYTSREHIEEIEYRVIKKDGSPEPFSREKLIGGLVRACEKRPVSVQQLEGIADRIESELQDRPDREIRTTDIGARIMEELRRIDQVAYVRFASVYRQFRDVGEFKREIDELQRETRPVRRLRNARSGAGRVRTALTQHLDARVGGSRTALVTRDHGP